jgi:hypothetical protein
MKMGKNFCLSTLIFLTGLLASPTKSHGVGADSRTVIEGKPTTLTLAPGVTTTIRLPEPVNSIILGDPSLFHAEYSPNEPLLVFARPISSSTAQSNLVISTIRGRQFILVLRSDTSSADRTGPPVDLLVICRPAGGFFIEETFPTALVSETVPLRNSAPAEFGSSERKDDWALEETLKRQRGRKLEKPHGEGIRVAIGEVKEQGSRLIVSFSVVNSKPVALELVPPQVQLAGQTTGGILKRTRWTTAQQLPVQAYQWSQRKLNSGVRADGVVVFERPSIKQSTEGLFLQVADSAAIDQPTLAPITFRPTGNLENEHE